MYIKIMEEKRLKKKSVMRHFPKIELHRHLEGTMPVRALYRLKQKNRIRMPGEFQEFKKAVQFPKKAKPDFLLFLSKFRNNWYKSHEDVYFITYESVRKLAEDGIFYIELRFSPEHYALVNDFDRMEITKLIVKAGNQAARDAGIRIRYLITFNRNKQTQKEMLKLYEKIRSLKLSDIVGIDLAGDEINFPPELFLDFFNKVYKSHKYGITIHAGEVTSPQQIWDAVQKLHAKRIGHGVAAARDDELQVYLKKKKIFLEQCITSNKQTGAWKDEKKHPLAELYRKGVPVTINSDDPVIQDTPLSEDYVKAVKYFGFTLNDLVQLNKNAIQASFLSEAEKKKLNSAYTRAVNRFKKEYLS